MIDTILIGIELLSSLTGVRASCNNYENINSINAVSLSGDETSMDVYNLYCQDQYKLYFEDENYILFDKENLTSTFISKADFEISENDFIVYNDNENFNFKFAKLENDAFINIENKSEKINFDLISSTLQSSKKAGNYYRNQPLSSSAIKIDNYEYFEKLGNRHALNNDNTCTVIAFEILLSYYDNFYNDNFVIDRYEVNAKEYLSKDDVNSFTTSPGSDSQKSGEETSVFKDYLVKLFEDTSGVDIEPRGITTRQQMDCIEAYFSNFQLSAEVNACEGTFDDIIYNKTIPFIKSIIDEGRPLISNGINHSTVAYAYDDEYVYVHTGWGYTAATPRDTFNGIKFSDNYFYGGIDFTYSRNHHHSYNYYNTKTNHYICSCGEIKK